LIDQGLLPYAQVGGTLIAAAGLFMNAYQVWRSRKSITLQHLQDFMKAMNERELALAEAKDDASKQRHAFVEFLNFLEIYSSAMNARLFVGVAQEMVRDKIMDSIVVLEDSSHWHDEIENSITSEITYKHLRRFNWRHRRTIAARKKAISDSNGTGALNG
jgi:hypothetical protein